MRRALLSVKLGRSFFEAEGIHCLPGDVVAERCRRYSGDTSGSCPRKRFVLFHATLL
jgi:hypothetical protein